MTTSTDRNAIETPGSPAKVERLRVTRTHDIDEQAALLRGWNQSYDQISSGSFNGSFLEARVGAVHLFREVTSNALHQTGTLTARTIAVGVPLALTGNATFCGQPCDGGQLHLFSGNDGFEFLSPCGLDMTGFVLTEDDLMAALTAEEQETLLPSLTSPHLRATCSEAMSRLRRLFPDVCEVLAQSSDDAYDAQRLSAMSRDVISALVAALCLGADESVERLSPAKRMLIVRQARELVTEHPDGYTSVEELCHTLGVSRRALQYSFQETLGLKPSAYLRAVRMNGARRAMRSATSVADAATLWGFWHFGRFARDYKAMFGELPSTTFRRLHGAPPPDAVL